MDLQQLRNAVEVAACGSITKAAKKLYMGQPNLSKRIRELEAEIGKPLFFPHGAGGNPHRERRGLPAICPQHH